jgi:hypothetical protein
MAKLNDWVYSEVGYSARYFDNVARIAVRCSDGYVAVMELDTEFNAIGQCLYAKKEDVLRHIMESAAKQLALIALEREDGHTPGTKKTS